MVKQSEFPLGVYRLAQKCNEANKCCRGQNTSDQQERGARIAQVEGDACGGRAPSEDTRACKGCRGVSVVKTKNIASFLCGKTNVTGDCACLK